MEPQLIRKIDAVVANSTFYEEYCKNLTDKSYYIGQGCDLRLFVKDKIQTVPDDIKHISKPIIGYVGVLDAERLDETIIKIIAEADPNWNVVLVGPSDESFKNSVLHQYPNVHFLGWKSIEELPAYINAFDVCMNPQWINNITRGNYPLKIDEYLAMGKPVVATRTKAMKFFEAYTYLADQPEEYPGLIRKALAEHTEEKSGQRMEFAHGHTWENCTTEIYKVIREHDNQAI
jgi:glycosyltransferase involved in cell wall biosynthesis